MCINAVDNALEFVPECYKILKMCYKNVDIYTFTIKIFRECFIT